MRNENTSNGRSSNAYLNGALTVIIALLGLNLLRTTVGLPAMSEAQAQRDRGSAVLDQNGGGLANPADDRRALISEMQRVNEKLDRLTAAVGGGKPIDVNVVSMPKGAGEKQNAGGGEKP